MPDDLAVVVGTSGSTGSPKRAMLTAGALRASAGATHDRLGGPGQWLLTLPAHHVAGLQVLLRSLDAGTEPVVMDLADGFTPTAFVAATALLDAGVRHYTSLVPTQLARLLGHAGSVEALACTTPSSSEERPCPRACAPAPRRPVCGSSPPTG